MTENEAIKVIETEKQCVLRNNENRCDRDCICCDLVMAENDIILGYDMATKSLKEIQQYREIGTVEECREAREKQMGKKPIKTPDCSDCENECNQNCISFNYGETYLCPNCHQNAIFNSEYDMFYKFCKNCGQAIDWGDTD